MLHGAAAAAVGGGMAEEEEDLYMIVAPKRGSGAPSKSKFLHRLATKVMPGHNVNYPPIQSASAANLTRTATTSATDTNRYTRLRTKSLTTREGHASAVSQDARQGSRAPTPVAPTYTETETTSADVGEEEENTHCILEAAATGRTPSTSQSTRRGSHPRRAESVQQPSRRSERDNEEEEATHMVLKPTATIPKRSMPRSINKKQRDQRLPPSDEDLDRTTLHPEERGAYAVPRGRSHYHRSPSVDAARSPPSATGSPTPSVRHKHKQPSSPSSWTGCATSTHAYARAPSPSFSQFSIRSGGSSSSAPSMDVEDLLPDRGNVSAGPHVPTNHVLSRGGSAPPGVDVAQEAAAPPNLNIVQAAAAVMAGMGAPHVSAGQAAQLGAVDSNEAVSLHEVTSELVRCPFYYGDFSGHEAMELLSRMPNDSFLIRNSDDCRSLFAVTYRTQNRIGSTRIQYRNGMFSFNFQDERLPQSRSVVQLVERCMARSETEPVCMVIIDNVQFYVYLRKPLAIRDHSLLQLARRTVRQTYHRGFLERLPLSGALMMYLLSCPARPSMQQVEELIERQDLQQHIDEGEESDGSTEV